MNQLIASTISELGLNDKMSPHFPTEVHREFIKMMLKQDDMVAALENCSPDDIRDFEANGLQSLVSAECFLDKMQEIGSKESYQFANIRLDIQVSNRTNDNAPDCTFNMVMATTKWKKTMNIAPATAEKLLSELIEAQNIIEIDRELQNEQKQ